MLEDLLGYLVGALEAEEIEACARALEADLELQRQVDLLRQALLPLELCQECVEIPADLAVRTWIVVRACISGSSDLAADVEAE